MAKKSKKKQLKNCHILSSVIVLIFVAITMIMMFLENIAYEYADLSVVFGDGKLNGTKSISGMQVIFGWGEEKLKIQYANFSILALLAYLLPVVGLLFGALLKGNERINALIAVALFAISSILLFIMPSLPNYADKTGLVFSKCPNIHIGFGAIIAGILSALNALIMLTKLMVCKK